MQGRRGRSPFPGHSGPDREAWMPTFSRRLLAYGAGRSTERAWPRPSRALHPVDGGRSSPNTAARLRRILTVFRFSKGPQTVTTWVSRGACRVKARGDAGGGRVKSHKVRAVVGETGAKGGKGLRGQCGTATGKGAISLFAERPFPPVRVGDGVVRAGFLGDVKKRTFPLTRVAALVNLLTSYPLAGSKR